jgi:hypothetical protein
MGILMRQLWSFAIAGEGIVFTDYYGEQSCTASRSTFITGQTAFRTGFSKVGMPGAPQGMKDKDTTIAALLKAQGYATGQFGKNHLDDLDEHLPTNHGFDEFFGNLYHLNAEEDPENEDYPSDLVMADGRTFAEVHGPRGVLKSSAVYDNNGAVTGQKIEDTGALTKKRMETVDDETVAATIEFIRAKEEEGTPWFVWWNGTRMHFRTHVSEERRAMADEAAGKHVDEYAAGMIEHDMHVGQLLGLLDELGIAEETVVFYSTDNGPHMNTWPDAAWSPFRGEKNSNWEGGWRVPAMVRWPGKIEAGRISNEIIMAAHAGMTTAEFETIVKDWIATARHPTTNRPYTEMVYQPMLELLAYLRANGFKTFIVSGGGIEFMRPWSEKVYGVLPERVIGSSIRVRYEMQDGAPVLVRLPELDFYDDKEGKPVAIHQQIGRRPIAAFGNSDGDLQMLQWTTAGHGPRFALYVHHTDGEREDAGLPGLNPGGA